MVWPVNPNDTLQRDVNLIIRYWIHNYPQKKEINDNLTTQGDDYDGLTKRSPAPASLAGEDAVGGALHTIISTIDKV